MRNNSVLKLLTSPRLRKKEYEEAIKLKSKAHAYEWSFNTKEKRKIFIKGYEAGVGYLGDGLYYTNN